MKGRKIAAIVLSSAMIVSGMGTVTMAEESTKVQQEVQTVQKASDSNAEKNQDTNKEEKQEVNQARSSNKEKASPSDATYVSTEEELRYAVRQEGKIILENNIELSEKLVIGGKEITIASDGARLSCGNDFDSETMLVVSDGADVMLEDIIIDATQISKASNKEYMAIYSDEKSNLIIQEGTVICYGGDRTADSNYRIEGVLLKGKGAMYGGSIYGFPRSGILIQSTGDFTLYGGEISDIIYPDDPERGGGGLSVDGRATIAGGSIYDCFMGVFNTKQVIVNDGEIYNNQYGLVNNTRTGDDVVHYPEAVMNGGSIYNNSKLAVNNWDGGVFIIPEDSTAQLEGVSKGIQTFSLRQAETTFVIRNAKGSKLDISGGSIVSEADNEIAIWNDQDSKLSMTGGQISVSGRGSVAIMNDNMTASEVTLAGGLISVSGEDSQALNNTGSMQVSDGLSIEENGEKHYAISVSQNQGGTVSVSAQTATEGTEIKVVVTPDNGYKIADVKIDVDSPENNYSFSFIVAHNHNVEVTFAPTNNGGGSSGGGSGSSSSRKTVSSVQNTIPETPGNWSQDATGWKFYNGNGSAYGNTWVRKNSQWYWIGEDGYMKDGWNLISEKWYYLMPVSGEMKTGWIADGENWYYADETGARVTGWVKTGDKWYYLNTDGKMAFSTTTPDGYKVDENGAMIE